MLQIHPYHLFQVLEYLEVQVEEVEWEQQLDLIDQLQGEQEILLP
tara:strand:+ start:102 stop:236 length:135 start_codon:yes stop_codon:yes gene_type:complete